MPRGPMKNQIAQALTAISSTQKEKLGTQYVDSYGHVWRYIKNGATELAAGKLVGAMTVTANHINCEVAAAAIGATEVTVTVGATAVTQDQYKGGELQIHDGTGEGHRYMIESNTACDASGDTILKLINPIRVALVASATTEVSLIPNMYNGVTITSSINCVPVGVPERVITASYYGWVQSRGLANVLTGDTSTVGTMAIPHATNGSVGAIASSTDVDAPIVGVFVTTGVAGEFGPIRLTID